MRPGSIYAAFGSKEGLFREALALYADGSRAAFEETLAAARSPLAGVAAHIRRLGSAEARAAPSRACMLVKTVLEAADEGDPLRREAEAAMREMERVFADAFRRAQAAGEISKALDADRLAWRLQSAIVGLRTYAQRSDVADRVSALAEDIARDVEALAQR